jgi:C-terminal processing protease CtpA/Prc
MRNERYDVTFKASLGCDIDQSFTFEAGGRPKLFVFICDIDDNGDAADAGVDEGDTLIAINGKSCEGLDVDSVIGMITEAGRPVTITFLCGEDGSPRTPDGNSDSAAVFLQARARGFIARRKVGKMQNALVAAKPYTATFEGSLGCEIDEAPGGGVRVVDVERGGPADQSGVQVGDRILSVGGLACVGLGVDAVFGMIAEANRPVSLMFRPEKVRTGN